ncbi:MAG TPA: ATP-binding cassette domain-containing protein [Nitrospiria bacterium]
MIRLEQVAMQKGRFRLEPLDLSVKSGEYFILLGPTGSGKTTVLELIAGLQSPHGGRIWWNDTDLTTIPLERRQIGVVYQGYHLFPHLTVRGNIQYGMRMQKLPLAEQEERTRHLAELLGIERLLDNPPSGLSGGEQQRVALARALAIEPRILLLDEPLSALDPQTRRQLQRDLKRLHEKFQTTTIHVTHSFEEALNLADRIGIVLNGRLLQVGAPTDVFRRPQSRPVAEFIGMENLFHGTIRRAENGGPDGERKVVFSTEGVELFALSDCTSKEGAAYAHVRPEEILLSTEPVHSSALNNFAGVVQEITDNMAVRRVVVDAGIPFVVFVTGTSLHRMDLKRGDRAHITFKASAVHLF